MALVVAVIHVTYGHLLGSKAVHKQRTIVRGMLHILYIVHSTCTILSRRRQIDTHRISHIIIVAKNFSHYEALNTAIVDCRKSQRMRRKTKKLRHTNPQILENKVDSNWFRLAKLSEIPNCEIWKRSTKYTFKLQPYLCGIIEIIAFIAWSSYILVCQAFPHTNEIV